mgnify:CR=1 FL=1
MRCAPSWQSRRIWQCKNCRKQFSVKVGTIFEDSPIPLSKWLPAMWMLVNCKNGVSSYEIARDLGVTQKTAWFMLHRLASRDSREVVRQDGRHTSKSTKPSSAAKPATCTRAKRKRLGISQSRSMIGKVAVMGLLERHTADDGGSTVRFKVIANRKKHQLEQTVSRERRQSVRTSTPMRSSSYDRHGTARLRSRASSTTPKPTWTAQVHTNGLENFWCLLKRALKGTYVSVEPFHLFRYLDEQVYRFNNRKLNDAGRFLAACASIQSAVYL